MSEETWSSWQRRRTLGGPVPPLDELLESKARAGVSISVCIPALNEEATIGDICRVVGILQDKGFVDQLLVVDSGSIDDTAGRAAGEGAEVFAASTVLSEFDVEDGGKGQAMWKGLSRLGGDLVCFLDADVRNFGPSFVTRLMQPLLDDPDLVMTKAFYERPLVRSDGVVGEGARVTELSLRPLLQSVYPALTGVIQPLAGECGCRRNALVEIPFVTGYGVEIGLLVDIVESHGLNALAQVDLGTRVHRNRDFNALGPTAFQVVQALLLRLEDHGLLKLAGAIPEGFVTFSDGHPSVRRAGARVLPPLATISAQE